jgi:hypothetical protein
MATLDIGVRPLAAPAVAACPTATAARPVTVALRIVLLTALAATLIGFYYLSVVDLNGRADRQIKATDHPFVISDIFPRWRGAQALLRGENPYAPEFTHALHMEYYGRVLETETEVAVLRSALGFFYPPFVVLPLLPLLWLPFEAVRWLTVVLLAGAMAWAVVLWARLSGGLPSVRRVGLAVLGAATFFPALDVLWLQQLTALVVLYLAGAYVAAGKGRFALAGCLLALATIKPQVAALPIGGLLLWSVFSRRRWSLPAAFVVAMVLQLGMSELLLPGWWNHFRGELARYQHLNTSSYWLPSLATGASVAGMTGITATLLLSLAFFWWRVRTVSADRRVFVNVAALTFASAACLVPSDISLYNRVLCLVPLMAILAHPWGRRPVERVSLGVVVLGMAVPVIVFAMGGWLMLLGHFEVASTLHLITSVIYIFQPFTFIPASVVMCAVQTGRGRSSGPIQGGLLHG